MKLDVEKFSNQFKILVLASIMILVAQNIGYQKPIIGALPGMLMIVAIATLSLLIRALTPKLKFPAFAWASMIALVLSMPFMPTSAFFLKYTKE
ncbi:MAG: hypothetical protein Q8N36_00595, partial [bacterium]|nr:hypothetical protein [bacterium]